MPNPMVTMELTETVRSQLCIAHVPAPPLGFRPFEPKWRRAFYPVPKGTRCALKLDAMICPACSSPRNMKDDWGWVWIIGDEQPLLQSGTLSQCKVCMCLVCSPTLIMKDRCPSTLHFKPMPKGIRHEPARHVPANGSV